MRVVVSEFTSLDGVVQAPGGPEEDTSGGIGHKNLVFSTVGDHRVFERLPRGPVKPALALSLHTTRADLRAPVAQTPAA